MAKPILSKLNLKSSKGAPLINQTAWHSRDAHIGQVDCKINHHMHRTQRSHETVETHRRGHKTSSIRCFYLWHGVQGHDQKLVVPCRCQFVNPLHVSREQGNEPPCRITLSLFRQLSNSDDHHQRSKDNKKNVAYHFSKHSFCSMHGAASLTHLMPITAFSSINLSSLRSSLQCRLHCSKFQRFIHHCCCAKSRCRHSLTMFKCKHMPANFQRKGHTCKNSKHSQQDQPRHLICTSRLVLHHVFANMRKPCPLGIQQVDNSPATSIEDPLFLITMLNESCIALPGPLTVLFSS